MFFLMGISNREREKAAYSLPCPRCHQRCLMTVTAQGHFFHLFFIPLIPFGTRYLAHCTECGTLYELSKIAAASLKRDGGASVRVQDMLPVAGPQSGAMRCPHCGASVSPDDAYCRRCGTPLSR